MSGEILTQHLQSINRRRYINPLGDESGAAALQAYCLEFSGSVGARREGGDFNQQ